MFLTRLCHKLNQKKVPYAIVGGHAVALHGAVRGTVDIDFVLKWTKAHLKSAVLVLESMGLVSRLPLTFEDVFKFRDEYIKNKNMIAWNFYNPKDLTEQVDLIINYDLSGKKITSKIIASEKVKILEISDLIKMKKSSGRPQDIEDVKALKEISHE